MTNLIDRKKYRMLLVTTVPSTLASILRGQPHFLSKFFDVAIATSRGAALKKVEKVEKCEINIVPMSRGINVFKDLFSIFRMIFVLVRYRPAIVHSYTPKAGLVSMVAAWVCRVPIRVHTFTGLIFPTSKGLKRRVLMGVDCLICFCATTVVPEGNGVKQDLLRNGITRKMLNVIGHGNVAGVDTSFFSRDADGVLHAASALRERLGISVNHFVFCFVGRLNRDKGLDELVQAFMALPGESRLLLAGAIDATAPVGEVTLKRMKECPRIHLLGFLDDIRPAVVASDIFVLPSYREGFPNVVLQAGALGVPVVATDINGSNEIVEENINGWLVPSRDSVALKYAMERASHIAKKDLEEMGRVSRERVVERFERTAHLLRMRDFYESLIKEAPLA